MSKNNKYYFINNKTYLIVSSMNIIYNKNQNNISMLNTFKIFKIIIF